MSGQIKFTNANDIDLILLKAIYLHVFHENPRGSYSKKHRHIHGKLTDAKVDPPRMLAAMIEQSTLFCDFMENLKMENKMDLMCKESLDDTEDLEDFILNGDGIGFQPNDRFKNVTLRSPKKLKRLKNADMNDNCADYGYLFDCTDDDDDDVNSLKMENAALSEKDEIIDQLKLALNSQHYELESTIDDLQEVSRLKRRMGHEFLMTLGEKAQKKQKK